MDRGPQQAAPFKDIGGPMTHTWIGTCIGLTAVLAFTARIAVATGDSQPPEPSAGTRTIFHCVIAGVRTFSDRPCGSAAQSPATGSATVELGPLNILKSPAAPAVSPSAKAGKSPAPRAATVSRRSTAAGRTAKAGTCGRIQQSLRKITSKMRSGYTAKEGERLRERKKDLEEKRRAQRC